MYQPSTPWGAQDQRTEEVLCTMTLVPGGAIGVRSWSNAPFNWASAERRGFSGEERSSFKWVGA